MTEKEKLRYQEMINNMLDNNKIFLI
jgi:hypothetical protein